MKFLKPFALATRTKLTFPSMSCSRTSPSPAKVSLEFGTRKQNPGDDLTSSQALLVVSDIDYELEDNVSYYKSKSLVSIWNLPGSRMHDARTWCLKSFPDDVGILEAVIDGRFSLGNFGVCA